MIHPATPYILIVWACVFLVDVLRGRVRCWWLWQGSPVMLGISYTFERGWPEGLDEEFPHGIPHHHAIDIGILLVAARIHWFGRVPSESRLPDTAPGGPGNEPPTPSTHGEEGTEKGRSQEADGPESGPPKAGQAEGPAQGREEGPAQAGS